MFKPLINLHFCVYATTPLERLGELLETACNACYKASTLYGDGESGSLDGAFVRLFSQAFDCDAGREVAAAMSDRQGWFS